MRIMQGRGNWCPNGRIETVRRYAFIGDSNVYGTGVAPDQTLPAHTERQMNELCHAWPVEAVNLGIAGYNLWNSWLAFRDAPQVYDGVVFGLCSNDADLFGRTLQLGYPDTQRERWESSHPFGATVVRCFDDMLMHSQKLSLPMAICFHNGWNNRDQLRICEIVRDLCSARGFLFIDTFALYRDRNLTGDVLFVSDLDRHPSAMAQEVTGRHLAAALRRQGWFGERDTSEIAAAPDRIVASAQAMVEVDHYPWDVALTWAINALDAKTRVAQRMMATQGADQGFSAAAARATDVLKAASRRWHVVNRVRAHAATEANGGSRIAWSLWRAEEERLRLQEIEYAINTEDRYRVTACIADAKASPQTASGGWLSDTPVFLDARSADLRRVREALDALRGVAAATAFGEPTDEANLLAALDELSRLADRVECENTALKAAFDRIEQVFNEAPLDVADAHVTQLSAVIGTALKNAADALKVVPQWLAAIQRLDDANHAAFTTVRATISCGPIEGSPHVILTGSIEYSVPHRLPFQDVGYCRSDGSPTTVTLNFPLLYAGRLTFRTLVPKKAGAQVPDFVLSKVEVHNGKNPRISLDPTTFYKDNRGRHVTPIICLA